MKAQMDYLPAYHNLLWGLRPRWSGSHQAMLALGLEAAKTKRFDTLVPFELIQTVLDIRRDAEDGFLCATQPEIYAQIKAVCEGYLREASWKNMHDYYAVLWAGFACQARAWDDAAKALASIKGEFHSFALDSLSMTADQITGPAMAYTGPHRALLEKASGLAAAGKFKEALAVLEPAVNKPQGQPEAEHFIASQVQALRWKIEFALGQWVALKFDEKLTGWLVKAGQWTPDGAGGVSGVPDATNGLMVLCYAQFGRNWELKTTVELAKFRWSNSQQGGVVLHYNHQPDFQSLRLWGDGGASLGQDFNGVPHVKAPVQAGKKAALRMTVTDEGVSVWVDGQQVYDQEQVPGAGTRADHLMGLGAYLFSDRDLLRYSDLQIRKIAPADQR
jgi:hypothetical protein